MNETTYGKIRRWRRKYEKLPNGWPVCAMIGTDYQPLEPKRKKRQQMI